VEMEEEDEESYWNDSKAKGFSWDDNEDSVGLPVSLSVSAASGENKDSEVLSFEPVSGLGSSASQGAWAERVREAVKAISRAADKPEPSIQQVLGGSKDVKKLEAELSLVRNKLANLQANRYVPLPPQQTVRDLILGLPYSLEGYRSLQEKEALLDAALEYGDGDAILAVTLHLRRTLKRAKFIAVLSCRQVACDQLVSYLVTRHELSQVVDLLQAMDRRHEAGVVAYKAAAVSGNLEVKVRSLKQCLASQSLRGHQDSHLIVEQVNLLERLSPVMSSEVGHLDRKPESLASASVLKALLYLATHHYQVQENLLHSPQALRKMHNLSDKQYTWICLRARASVSSWGECQDLVMAKSWLGGRKAKGCISPTEVVSLLAAAGAPSEALAPLLSLVDNVDDRLSLAKRVKVHSVVVDCLVALKDRMGLMKHQQGLEANSQDWFYANNALSNSNVKWKN